MCIFAWLTFNEWFFEDIFILKKAKRFYFKSAVLISIRDFFLTHSLTQAGYLVIKVDEQVQRFVDITELTIICNRGRRCNVFDQRIFKKTWLQLYVDQIWANVDKMPIKIQFPRDCSDSIWEILRTDFPIILCCFLNPQK